VRVPWTVTRGTSRAALVAGGALTYPGGAPRIRPPRAAHDDCDVALRALNGGRSVAISTGGARTRYVGNSGGQLVRSIDRLDATAITGLFL
jgi:hypothetical protein